MTTFPSALLSQHPLFKDNILVTGSPHIRFYAGVALNLRFKSKLMPREPEQIVKVGTLCVISDEPRERFR